MTYANLLPGVPVVESPFFEQIAEAKSWPAETVEIARKLRKDGFAVIDFPEPDFGALATKVIKSLDTSYDWEA